jgi:hypothetical protein
MSVMRHVMASSFKARHDVGGDEAHDRFRGQVGHLQARRTVARKAFDAHCRCLGRCSVAQVAQQTRHRRGVARGRVAKDDVHAAK